MGAYQFAWTPFWELRQLGYEPGKNIEFDFAGSKAETSDSQLSRPIW
jgi:hypothetical protein